MSALNNVPQLRFPEFNGEWNEKKLETIASFSKGKGISKADIIDDGILECIRYGELYTRYSETIHEVHSKTNLDVEGLVLSEHNDVIIPASGESQIDIATASCVLKDKVALSGDINIIKTPENGVFLAYYLNNAKKIDIARLAQGISVVHLYSSQLKSLQLLLPIQEEQQKIASFLTAVDTKIEQLTKKQQLLEEYKKGVMQKVFSQEIRFHPKGISSQAQGKADDGSEFPEWEEKKLGEITKKVSKKNKENKDFPVYSISNQHGFIPQSEQFDGLNSKSRNYDISMYKIIGKETFAYNPARINVGSIGFSGELEDIIISSLYVCFKTTKELDDEFLLQYLDTFDFHKSVLRNVEGGVRDYLFYENFSHIKIMLPSLAEQTRIVSFLSSIDSKIDLAIKELANAKQFKKALLQQMFV